MGRLGLKDCWLQSLEVPIEILTTIACNDEGSFAE